MEKLYMLPIGNERNLNERIKKLRNGLVNTDYKIYISGKSLAVYIEDAKEDKYEKKEVEKIIQENNEMKYEDFFYNMKKIARSNKFR